MTPGHDERMRFQRSDAVDQASMDAQADVSGQEAKRFRARLVLLLANLVGDDGAVVSARARGRESAAVLKARLDPCPTAAILGASEPVPLWRNR